MVLGSRKSPICTSISLQIDARAKPAGQSGKLAGRAVKFTGIIDFFVIELRDDASSLTGKTEADFQAGVIGQT